MSFVPLLSLFLILFAIFYHYFQIYWVYIPAIIDYIHYPLPGPNKEIIWHSSSSSLEEGRSSIRSDESIIMNKNSNSHSISTRTSTNDKLPNFIVILADDLGFNDISFYSGGYGNGIITTPSIDSIGNDGIVFTQAYAGHATCAPSRASLLTGKYSTKIGYEYTPSSSWAAWVLGSFMNIGPLKGIYHKENAKNDSETFSFPLNHQIISEALAPYGYNSIQFGKWHNGYDAISAPINRGFNQSLGFNLISSYLPVNDPNSMNCYFEDTFDRLIWANVRYGVKANNGKYFQPKGYLTDYLAEEAAKAIEVNKNNPFFLYVAMSSIHTPLQALKSDYDICIEKFSRSENSFHSGSDSHCNCVYGGMILALDRAVGTILKALDKHNLTDDTIVIFTSDNGGTSVANQRYINYPFRGWKATFFEGGLRVPFLMKWPKYIPKYQVNNDIISHVDIFPTLADAAAKSAKRGALPTDLDGMSLLPHILPSIYGGEAPPPPRSSKYCETTSNIHQTLFWRSGHYSSIRHCQWKYQISLNPKKIWLYDIVNDPKEINNLALTAASDPYIQEVLQELSEILHRENNKQVKPLWDSLSETPILIDKIYREQYAEGDEYIYWPN